MTPRPQTDTPMPNTGHPFRALRRFCLLALLAVVVVVTGQDAPPPPPPPMPMAPDGKPLPTPQAAELQTALAELRELRQARQRQQENWAAEKAELEHRLRTENARLEQAEAKLDAATAARDATAKQLAAYDGALEVDTQDAPSDAAVEARLDAVRAAIAAWYGPAEQRPQPNHILLDDAFWAALPDPASAPLETQVESLLASLDAAAARGWGVDVRRETMIIPQVTEPQTVRILRLGGAVEYFLTDDGKYAGSRQGSLDWRALPDFDAAELRRALAVFSGAAEPAIVILPLSYASGQYPEGAQP